MKIGYKIMRHDFTCQATKESEPFQYKIGETYTTNKEIKIGKWGYHFCLQLPDCIINRPSHYDENNIRAVAVAALGDVIRANNSTCCCTNKIKILYELTPEEITLLMNYGANNVGNHNIGGGNIGHFNCGDQNIGNSNYGSGNHGYGNHGSTNVGAYNLGTCNCGNRNYGDTNCGDHNYGSQNRGICNYGDSNCGSYNYGGFNLASNVVGYFNTQAIAATPTYMFNKPTQYNITDLKHKVDVIPFISRLININCPSKAYDSAMLSSTPVADNIAKNLQTWNNSMSAEAKAAIVQLPNFDAEIFKQITGIELSEKDIEQIIEEVEDWERSYQNKFN